MNQITLWTKIVTHETSGTLVYRTLSHKSSFNIKNNSKGLWRLFNSINLNKWFLTITKVREKTGKVLLYKKKLKAGNLPIAVVLVQSNAATTDLQVQWNAVNPQVKWGRSLSHLDKGLVKTLKITSDKISKRLSTAISDSARCQNPKTSGSTTLFNNWKKIHQLLLRKPLRSILRLQISNLRIKNILTTQNNQILQKIKVSNSPKFQSLHFKRRPKSNKSLN